MSSDLLKEFGFPQDPIPSQVAAQGTAKETAAEEEEFGDFEDAESDLNTSGTQLEPENIHAQTSSTGDVTNSSEDGDNRDVFADQSVLFDAEETIKTHKASLKQSRTRQEGPQEPLIVSLAPIPPTKAPTTSTLDLFQSETLPVPQAPIPPLRSPIKSDTDAVRAPLDSKPGFGAAKAGDLGPPPSNVPPPSVLLPLVATVFQSMSTNVRKSATFQPASSDPYEPLDQSRIQSIQEVLSDARAGARILAGRKLRWKRDNILSQSMKIGPASGKTSGMKLAGVDKAETRREDQEAAEALRAWKQQVGVLRSTISMINVHLSGGGLSMPDISEAMPIRVSKASEGAVTAPKCCFLCGIKRDERIAKVDVDVEDSFGEWWREHWGHVDCSAFWSNHKASLRQR
ncbi:hypothetical protein JMJ35_007715 [Cladonia borealis]|uniref:Uncharacterized protein n=1 Tax=Cladonia borealis TaxID=184061 RepID=A0AA39QYU8_9LECA|nr:hypothetical protein JMJ35_007715 [Cladonia borealis]